MWARLTAMAGAVMILALVAGLSYLFQTSWVWDHFRFVGVAIEATYCLPVFLYLQHRWPLESPGDAG